MGKQAILRWSVEDDWRIADARSTVELVAIANEKGIGVQRVLSRLAKLYELQRDIDRLLTDETK
jgi:hypothetical protein